jgi:DNA-binding XRE family transcriptional regulator
MHPKKEELILYQNNILGVSEHFNVSKRTARRWLKRHNLLESKNCVPNKLKDCYLEIRRLEDKYTQKQLAEMYDVTQAAIGKIVNNISYKTNLQIKGSAIVNYGSQK